MSGPDPDPSPRAPAPPAVPAGPWRRRRVPCAVPPAEALGMLGGLGIGLGSSAPTSREMRAAAANCCSGCGCWRARLNQGRLLTRRPCPPATNQTGYFARPACMKVPRSGSTGCPGHSWSQHTRSLSAQDINNTRDSINSAATCGAPPGTCPRRRPGRSCWRRAGWWRAGGAARTRPPAPPTAAQRCAARTRQQAPSLPPSPARTAPQTALHEAGRLPAAACLWEFGRPREGLDGTFLCPTLACNRISSVMKLQMAACLLTSLPTDRRPEADRDIPMQLPDRPLKSCTMSADLPHEQPAQRCGRPGRRR